MANDKPTNVLNVNDLDLEGKASEPIRVPVKGDGFVEFPNPFERDAEDAEEFLTRLYEGMSNGRIIPVLKTWLPEAAFVKFRKAYPSYRATLTIVNAVVGRFEGAFGDSGEGDASES